MLTAEPLGNLLVSWDAAFVNGASLKICLRMFSSMLWKYLGLQCLVKEWQGEIFPCLTLTRGVS